MININDFIVYRNVKENVILHLSLKIQIHLRFDNKTLFQRLQNYDYLKNLYARR